MLIHLRRTSPDLQLKFSQKYPEDKLTLTRQRLSVVYYILHTKIKVHRTTSFSVSIFADTRMRGILVTYVTLITQQGDIHARTHANLRGCARVYDVEGDAICSKNSNIVPHHRYSRIPQLTVSVSDYGS